MKKFFLFLLIILTATLAFASCGGEKVYHTVKFEYGTNTAPEYVRYEYGALIDEPEQPTKEGYIFKGWYSERNGAIWNFDTDKLTTDVTLVAKWQRITKTITFDSNGGDGVAAREVGIGDLVPKPQNPTKKDHLFKGWFLGETEWNFEENRVSEDITLVAKWEPCPTFTVTFDTAGGSQVSQKHIVLGGLVPSPDAPTRDGYVFIDWKYNGEPWNFGSNTVSSDITLVAEWKKIEIYTVTFDTDGGSAVAQVMVTEGHKLPSITPPTKRYYVFDGWTADGAKIELSTFIPTKNTTLKAAWISISNFKYTVTFDADNGSPKTEKELSGYSLIDLPQQPMKEGFIFLGWFNGEVEWRFDTDRVESDITLTAKWSKNTETKFSVTLDPDNGNSPTVISVPQNSKVTLPDEPKKAGFVFDGWYDGESKWNFAEDKVTKDTVLKAKWTKAHTVTFVTDGTPVEPQFIREGSVIRYKEAITTKDGKIFDGWFIGNVKWTPYSKVTGDVTLTASWREPRTFKLIFEFPDDIQIDNEEEYLENLPTYVVEGQRLTTPAEPITTKTNLRFGEWKIKKVDSYGKEYYDSLDFYTFIADGEWMPTDENGNIIIVLKAEFTTLALPIVPFA